jgi:hypothetical protein
MAVLSAKFFKIQINFFFLKLLVHTTLIQTCDFFIVKKQFSALNGCMEMKYYTVVKMFR